MDANVEVWVRKNNDKGWVEDNIGHFFEGVASLKLHVTKRASVRLERFLIKLKSVPGERQLSAEEAQELVKIMLELKATLIAELQGLEAYILNDKRFELKKLLHEPTSLFAPGVFGKCSDIAKHDIEEAGKCIAFERGTAAAFHILRATEEMLKNLYLSKVRTNKVSDFSMGSILSDLKKRTLRKKIPQDLIEDLDMIRRNYRNPTQHPQLRYTVEEAQDLLGSSIGVVNRICALLD